MSGVANKKRLIIMDEVRMISTFSNTQHYSPVFHVLPLVCDSVCAFVVFMFEFLYVCSPFVLSRYFSCSPISFPSLSPISYLNHSCLLMLTGRRHGRERRPRGRTRAHCGDQKSPRAHCVHLQRPPTRQDPLLGQSLLRSAAAAPRQDPNRQTSGEK